MSVLCIVGVVLWQGQFVASWKTRYFVLLPGKLSYYNSDSDRVGVMTGVVIVMIIKMMMTMILKICGRYFVVPAG